MPSDEALTQEVHADEPEDLLTANIELFCHASAIPFQNRLRYLVGDKPPSYTWVPLDEIASKLGTNEETLEDIIFEMHVPEELCNKDADEVIHLSADVDVVLSDEYKWRQKYAETDNFVTAPQIADIFGMKVDFIEALMKKIGIPPIKIRPDTKTAIYFYPKELLFRVRSEIITFPIVRDGRKNKAQVADELGVRRNWIESRMGEDADPDLMRTESNWRVLEYYSDIFINRLKNEKDTLSSQNDASTVTYPKSQIIKLLGMDRDWIDRELLGYITKKKTKVDLYGKSYDEYPESVFLKLQALTEKIRHAPIATEEEVGLTKLVTPIGIGNATAELILTSLGVVPVKKRLPYKERLIDVYNVDLRPAIVDGLVELREQRYVDLVRVISRLEADGEALKSVKRAELKKLKLQASNAKMRLNDAYKIWQRFYGLDQET